MLGTLQAKENIMKLKFCLHGIHLKYLYNTKRKYPVIWIDLSDDFLYPRNLLPYIDDHYNKGDKKIYWANYILKKLD